jgi:hypothetical protein
VRNLVPRPSSRGEAETLCSNRPRSSEEVGKRARGAAGVAVVVVDVTVGWFNCGVGCGTKARVAVEKLFVPTSARGGMLIRRGAMDLRITVGCTDSDENRERRGEERKMEDNFNKVVVRSSSSTVLRRYQQGGIVTIIPRRPPPHTPALTVVTSSEELPV